MDDFAAQAQKLRDQIDALEERAGHMEELPQAVADLGSEVAALIQAINQVMLIQAEIIKLVSAPKRATHQRDQDGVVIGSIIEPVLDGE